MRNAILIFSFLLSAVPLFSQHSAEDKFNQGYMLYENEKYAEAIRLYTEAISLDATVEDYYFHRGVCLSLTDDNQSAIEDFNRAITIDPEYAEALFERAYSYYLTGNDEKSIQDYDAAEAAYARAAAALVSAEAQIQQAAAQLAVNETELANADVVSPISGIVLSRLVEPGQTVAATFQTPELFVIAEDLRELELSIEIDEADVGKIMEGQAARFTVDAYPDEEFPAEITQVRYAPISSVGVVTYESILSVDNADLRLRPGMTATAVITVQQIDDALLVPNAALRFSPRLEQHEASEGGLVSALVPRPPRGSAAPAIVDENGGHRRIWLLDEKRGPRAVDILIGATDGVSTEIKAGDLALGAQVIIEQRDPS